MNVALLSLLAICLASTPAPVQSSDWKPWLDSQATEFSGVVLIGRDDMIQIESAYGFADAAKKRANTPATRFNLGSINKTFTAVAVAQLIQQGLLSLDDTLVKYLPDYPNKAAAARITIRDLVTHRSGVAQFIRADFGNVSVSEMLKTVAAEPQAFEPGSQQAYSNGGYVVLGRVVEVVSGQPYATYIAEHIYRPAGMVSSGFYHPGDRQDNLAQPIPGVGAGGRVGGASTSPPSGGVVMMRGGPGIGPPTEPRPGNPAGGGYSTASDLFRFSRALRAGKLLDQRMTEYVISGTFAEQPPFGFSLRQQAAGSHRFIGNGGGAPGVNAEFRFEPKGEYTVVVLSNTGPPAATDLLLKVVNRIGSVAGVSAR